MLLAAKRHLPERKQCTSTQAYWERAKFGDEWSQVNKLCLECKKGNARKIENCKANWCNAFSTKLVPNTSSADAMPTPGAAEPIPGADALPSADLSPESELSE